MIWNRQIRSTVPIYTGTTPTSLVFHDPILSSNDRATHRQSGSLENIDAHREHRKIGQMLSKSSGHSAPKAEDHRIEKRLYNARVLRLGRILRSPDYVSLVACTDLRKNPRHMIGGPSSLHHRR
jgi:hypothetical protein